MEEILTLSLSVSAPFTLLSSHAQIGSAVLGLVFLVLASRVVRRAKTVGAHPQCRTRTTL